MSFSQIIGNDMLKQRLTSAIDAGQLFHAYIICGAKGSGKHTLARCLMAAMECTAHGGAPCGVCSQCKKVFSGTHPDIVTVDDPEKKTVQVALARETQKDLFIRPNEGKKKIYLFPRGEDMRPETQNALLKILEEPPEYGAFILLTESAEALLPTVRSRCVELQLAPVPEAEAMPYLQKAFPQKDAQDLRAAYARGGGYLGQASAILSESAELNPFAVRFLSAYAASERLEMLDVLCAIERSKGEKLSGFLQGAYAIASEALRAKYLRGTLSEPAEKLCDGKSTAAILQLVNNIRDALAAADANVGAGHICGYFAACLL